jgi:hypothetical protein
MNTLMNLKGIKPGKFLELSQWFPTSKGPPGVKESSITFQKT